MDTWRLLPLETNNAFMNMSIDEAILNARIACQVPNTLRFYCWQPSAVSIGKNQNLESEVYLDVCKQLGVDVVRRISGGGTVFHDCEGEVTYCIAAKTETLGTPDIIVVYAKIYEAIKDALRLLGITADFNTGDARNCPNMTVGGKKISGSSQSITRGVVLQHGTLLRSINIQKMFQLLKLKNATFSQAADIGRRKITSIQNELGHAVSSDTIGSALAQGFKAMLKIQLEPSALTHNEIGLAKKLCKEKYSKKEWNFEGKITN